MDGHFYQTPSNADNQCNLFYVQLYSQWQAIPEKLSFYLYGGLYRFYNRGEDYRHTYNAFNGGASVQTYLGKWTLSAYADNGNMIALKLAIRLDHGRHYRDIQRTMEHQDTETDILSTTK
ncbi:MAG: hypothetical protein IJ209_06800 [Bacteroidaceae bacterium]|nr:hypothetical protein [Bacteroidaceae bacterium]